jgi:hypothetical protein
MAEFNRGCVCGHDDGRIVIYDASYVKIRVLQTSVHKVTSILGVKGDIWAGTSAGRIHVFSSMVSEDGDDMSSVFESLDMSKNGTSRNGSNSAGAVHYRKIKDFQAANSGITGLWLEEASMTNKRMDIISLCDDGQFTVWDGLLARDWMERQLAKREAEYCTFSTLRVVVGSWYVEN